MKTKFKAFRNLLNSKQTSFILEAHTPISAKIVEDAGFSAIWASGLTISSSCGVRDANELSFTQVLNILETIQENVEIPIIVDGDTGFGNFNTFRILVKKLCKLEIAAVCIEDKIFPKNNSFSNRVQQLEDIESFCNKIKAGKDTQTNNSFSIIARTESLICGLGVDDALERCQHYVNSGADGIIIHSKKKDGKEIINFLDQWQNQCPVIIIPTTYYKVPNKEFIDRKVSIIIWANHLLRAAVYAMQSISKKLYLEQSLAGIEHLIAPIEELFRLSNDDELKQAENKYLSSKTIYNTLDSVDK